VQAKFEDILRNYKNALVVGVDNVGSLQMAKIRVALRGKAGARRGRDVSWGESSEFA
jgi:hypothetical protein